MLTQEFLFILFILVFGLSFFYICILTLPAIRVRVHEIASVLSIPLSIVAIISSFGSIYYITEVLKHPEINVAMNYENSKYFYKIKNIGNEDAHDVYVTGHYVDFMTRKKIGHLDNVQVAIPRNGGWVGPFFIKNLENNKKYQGVIGIGCKNCRQEKRWVFIVDNKNKNIRYQPIATTMSIITIEEDGN